MEPHYTIVTPYSSVIKWTQERKKESLGRRSRVTVMGVE